MKDLKNPLWIHLKGFLFLLILTGAATGIILHMPSWRIALLTVLTIWASARLYYYLFYVIENYIDQDFRFSGIYSAARYLMAGKTRPPRSPDGNEQNE